MFQAFIDGEDNIEKFHVCYRNVKNNVEHFEGLLKNLDRVDKIEIHFYPEGRDKTDEDIFILQSSDQEKVIKFIEKYYMEKLEQAKTELAIWEERRGKINDFVGSLKIC